MDTEFKITENSLSNEMLQKLHQFTRTGKQPDQTNFFGYNIGVIGVSNAIFAFTLDKDIEDEILNELIQKNIFQHKPKKYTMHINLFSRGAFIPWHDDHSYMHTVTIYLNEIWSEDWGGAFLYKKPTNFLDIACIYPKQNLAVSFKPPLYHSTTLTTINAPFRESLQIFVREF